MFSHSAKKILCSSKLLNYDNRKFLGCQIRDYWLGVVRENSPNSNKPIKQTIYKLSLTSIATENALFWHCSRHVFERHRQTLSREISFFFLLTYFNHVNFLNRQQLKNEISLLTKIIFWCLYNVCEIASVRISHWSGIKQIGEEANILF